MNTTRNPVPRRAARAACLSLALAAASPGGAALAQGLGDLTVSPTRVVFEGRTRSAQLALIHRGSGPATYRISFIRMRMGDAGEIAEISEAAPGERFADRLVRYSPRQVTLEPGVAQTVRLLLRKPADLDAGEYRSHLLLRAIPAAETGASIEALDSGEQDIAIELTPIYGVSVPVIVRQGDLAAEARLAELALLPAADDDPQPILNVRLERRGERSLYGDLEVVYEPPGGRPRTVLGLYKGLAVYAPNAARTLSLPLALPAGLTLGGGRLRVSFSEAESGDAVAARAEIPVS